VDIPHYTGVVRIAVVVDIEAVGIGMAAVDIGAVAYIEMLVAGMIPFADNYRLRLRWPVVGRNYYRSARQSYFGHHNYCRTYG
jgi:hypothetical protein